LYESDNPSLGAVFSSEGEEVTVATTTHVPVEVYLRSSYEPDAEYVDGKIEERPLGEFDHASWQEAVLAWFRQHRTEWGVRALPKLRLKVAETRFRVPDVAVLDRNQPREQIIAHPPLAVFEILSPEDTLQKLKRRRKDYRIMGVEEIRVIDPRDRTFYRYEDGQLLRNDTFSHSRGIAFEMKQIRDLLDE
jgi:Uma2 family endonuclease